MLTQGRGIKNACNCNYVIYVWSQSTLPLNTTGPFAGLKLIKQSIKKDTNFENGITICLRFRISEIMSCEDSVIFVANLAHMAHIKVEKILKYSLDSIPSPSTSVKIQIMCWKVCLRCKGKTLLGTNFLFSKVC